MAIVEGNSGSRSETETCRPRHSVPKRDRGAGYTSVANLAVQPIGQDLRASVTGFNRNGRSCGHGGATIGVALLGAIFTSAQANAPLSPCRRVAHAIGRQPHRLALALMT
ncbi:hypothetical protein B5K11_23510 [Rhizobium leguminosarum bv. trifolii]|uniref:hypothetical protein n=1 Tax=Rhizobium leguminosarum TaxID=384 RepID=UPI000E2F348E|nr:hypothetical protein [Rhizobium leguminosarum]RFB88467.1 hypothetical protein B5K11_23510 [Rhizobium leguminosarum bv. trifolii]